MDHMNWREKQAIIKKMIESRILGTGVHLTNPEPYRICLGYSQIPVWGIKKALTRFVDDNFSYIIQNIDPESNQSLIEQIRKSLFRMAGLYRVDPEILEKKLEKLKIPKENWNYMDQDMKIAVTIGAYFDAFDETRIRMLKENPARSDLYKLLERDKASAPDIKYGLEDFGFVFRARNYTHALSEIRFNGGYSTVLSRLDKVLKRLYREYFVEDKRKMSHKRGMPTRSRQKIEKDEDRQAIIDDLESEEKSRILKALNVINRRKLKSLVDKLEYFFNHEDEEIMNKSFEIYMELREQ